MRLCNPVEGDYVRLVSSGVSRVREQKVVVTMLLEICSFAGRDYLF